MTKKTNMKSAPFAWVHFFFSPSRLFFKTIIVGHPSLFLLTLQYGVVVAGVGGRLLSLLDDLKSSALSN